MEACRRGVSRRPEAKDRAVIYTSDALPAISG
jgi:hypothetical protein